MTNIIKNWRSNYRNRKKYAAMDRIPYFEIAAQHLPEDKGAVIADIGSGKGLFAEHLKLRDKYKNIYLLDTNDSTIKYLEDLGYKNSIQYTAPSKLPFKDNSLDFIHTSHMIEHLSPNELYIFLSEVNRTLKKDGILVISTPMLWNNFYDDLTHIKPYHPESLIHYLCYNPKNRTKENLKNKYSILNITYRYTKIEENQLGSENKLIDFIILIYSMLVKKVMKIHRYKKNAYTIVFKKQG